MNYNREFLVPYLESICALHLATEKLSKMNNEHHNRINAMKRGYNTTPPKPPVYETFSVFNHPVALILGSISLVFCVLCIISYIVDPFLGGFQVFASLFYGGITFGFFRYIHLSKEVTEIENKEKKESYEKALATVKMNAVENEKLTAMVPQLEAQRKICVGDLEKARDLLREFYNVNIIPSQYRNLYAAVYLYDYFKTSQSTDLERALTLYVLEEIKSRLDTIIQQHSQAILNQQIMIANQRKTHQLQQAHAKSMRAKLDNIIASNEERNTYLEMIEANTKATAYFAAANYLK